jgi:hypothetical protein
LKHTLHLLVGLLEISSKCDPLSCHLAEMEGLLRGLFLAAALMMQWKLILRLQVMEELSLS